jgi:glyoxylase-like metal-dependent hydrolase (beta-lactamase superfamily II)
MYLDRLDDNPFGTNCWVAAAEGSDEAVVVDPGFHADRVRALLEAAGKRPVAVLATHGHGDHVGQAAAMSGTDLPCYIHEADALAFEDPVAWGSGYPFQVERPADLRTLRDGEVLDFAGFSIEVIHTPGHTPGSVCFATDAFVFSGDLVFAGTVGRSDFPNSSPADMEQSLIRFLKLPDELDIYPGHMEATTVGRERRTNPFLVSLT